MQQCIQLEQRLIYSNDEEGRGAHTVANTSAAPHASYDGTSGKQAGRDTSQLQIRPGEPTGTLDHLQHPMHHMAAHVESRQDATPHYADTFSHTPVKVSRGGSQLQICPGEPTGTVHQPGQHRSGLMSPQLPPPLPPS